MERERLILLEKERQSMFKPSIEKSMKSLNMSRSASRRRN